MIEELDAWLTAIYDEQEKQATAAAEPYGPDWGTSELSDDVYSERGGYVACGAYGYMEEGIRYFIASYDPAAVLARIAVERRILDWLFVNARDVDGEWGDGHTAAEIRAGKCHDHHVQRALLPLRLMASLHADRPGYQEVWRP